MSRSAVFILGIFLFMSICDIFRGEEINSEDVSLEFKDEFEAEAKQQEAMTKSENKKWESSEQSTDENSPILKFLYCVSCGYKQAFKEFSRYAKEKYPGITVEGGNFDPVFWKYSLAQLITFAKSSILVMIVAGTNPFESIGFGYPRVLQYAHRNKITSGLMLYFVSNLIESMLYSTGAFEIYLNGNQIWSKLETGRVPSQEEFIQLLEANVGN